VLALVTDRHEVDISGANVVAWAEAVIERRAVDGDRGQSNASGVEDRRAELLDDARRVAGAADQDIAAQGDRDLVTLDRHGIHGERGLVEGVVEIVLILADAEERVQRALDTRRGIVGGFDLNLGRDQAVLAADELAIL